MSPFFFIHISKIKLIRLKASGPNIALFVIICKGKLLLASRRRDLNPRPADYESAALPAKPRRHTTRGNTTSHRKKCLSLRAPLYTSFYVTCR